MCIRDRTGEVPAVSALALCPNCETPLLAGQEECPVCSKEIHEPPSTWTLLRLGRFARPYRGQLLAGFLLSLVSTAATLVAPYLTMPLMDNVLIPYPVSYTHLDVYKRQSTNRFAALSPIVS